MLEATQTASGEIVFEQSKQWEGQVVNGTYPLRQYIGGSDHSAVFLTEILSENPHKVAIKLIAADEANADIQLGRLRLSAKLSHPHLLQIFEVGRCELGDHQLLFVAMEYADENLAQILPQRPLTPQETRDLLIPTLDTLAYIHNNGFAHGRLKPTNILVAGEQIKLSSDGLCRPGALASKQPSPYDPPEASSEGLTPAGDLWSLGVTLSETVTQRLPTWADRLRGEPSLPDKMPEPFAEIARHCVVRDPRSRWKVPEIRSRLNAPSPALKEQPKPISVVAAVKPQKRNNYWLYAIPLAAMVGIILLLAGLLHRSPNQKPKAGQNTASSAQAVPRSSARSEASKAREGTLAPEQVIRQVVPDVPAKALRTISGRFKVTVRAHVDERGNVTRAEFASAGPSRYFANLTMQSAQEWKFTPTQTPKTWLLQFTFTRSGVTVQPRQIG
jgi:serine/threonine protein kinase